MKNLINSAIKYSLEAISIAIDELQLKAGLEILVKVYCETWNTSYHERIYTLRDLTSACNECNYTSDLHKVNARELKKHLYEIIRILIHNDIHTTADTTDGDSTGGISEGNELKHDNISEDTDVAISIDEDLNPLTTDIIDGEENAQNTTTSKDDRLGKNTQSINNKFSNKIIGGRKVSYAIEEISKAYSKTHANAPSTQLDTVRNLRDNTLEDISKETSDDLNDELETDDIDVDIDDNDDPNLDM